MLQGVDDIRPLMQRFWDSLDANQQSRLTAMMSPATANAATVNAQH
jgi:hypothetical protein